MLLNGKEVQISENTCIKDILDKYNLNPEKVVVEVNMEIIDENDYDTYLLKDEYSVEVISFVGGG